MLQEFEGSPEDVESLGADYLPQPCGDPECTCHIDYPYVVIVYKDGEAFAAGRAGTALNALAGIQFIQNQLPEKVVVEPSACFDQILKIEVLQLHCQKTTDGKVHKEDKVKLFPGDVLPKFSTN
jgi:hypothetical protein